MRLPGFLGTLFGTGPSAPSLTTSVGVLNQDDVRDVYFADTAEKSRDHDKFNRRYFAERVAHTIAAQRDPNGLLIGIYGAWGEGKTGVLHFIASTLDESFGAAVVTVWFNPWRFGDEAHLLRETLYTRREAAKRVGPWVEGHYRPGIQVYPAENETP